MENRIPFNISKETVALWEKTLAMKDDGSGEINWEKLIDVIHVPIQEGIEVQLMLYNGYNKNVLLVNGQEVDSWELSNEFSCREYYFHHKNDTYIVILEEA